MKRALHVAVVLACAAVRARVAHADDDPRAEARAEARTLAERGDTQFYAGRCDKAIDLWQKAYALFPAPTIAVRVARCQALLGKVVDAAATLDAVADADAVPGEPSAFAAARAEAKRDLASARKRIATLRFALRPPIAPACPSCAKAARPAVAIAIDGSPAPAGKLEIAVDPGAHHVRVRAENATWEREVHLDDGETRTLDVAIWIDPPPAPPRAQRIAGLAFFGTGVASLAAGIGLAVSALTTARGLDATCGADRSQCPPSEQGAVARVRTYSLAADGALGGGALLSITGAVLLATDRSSNREAPRVRLALSPRGAALHGDF